MMPQSQQTWLRAACADCVEMLTRDPVSLSGLAMVYATKATFCTGARLTYKNKEYCVKAPCNAGLEIEFQTTAWLCL